MRKWWGTSRNAADSDDELIESSAEEKASQLRNLKLQGIRLKDEAKQCFNDGERAKATEKWEDAIKVLGQAFVAEKKFSEEHPEMDVADAAVAPEVLGGAQQQAQQQPRSRSKGKSAEGEAEEATFLTIAKCYSNLAHAWLVLEDGNAALVTAKKGFAEGFGWPKLYLRLGVAQFHEGLYWDALHTLRHHECIAAPERDVFIRQCEETLHALGQLQDDEPTAAEGGSNSKDAGVSKRSNPTGGFIVRQLISGVQLLPPGKPMTSDEKAQWREHRRECEQCWGSGQPSPPPPKGRCPSLVRFARTRSSCTYLVADAESRECVVVDPAWDPDAIVRIIKTARFKPKAIVLTSTHFDHAGGVPPGVLGCWIGPIGGVKETLASVENTFPGTNIPVWISAKEENAAEKLRIPAEKLELCSDSTQMFLGANPTPLVLVHTPGITPASMSVFIPSVCLLSGDMLEMGSVGSLLPSPGTSPLGPLSESSFGSLPCLLSSLSRIRKLRDTDLSRSPAAVGDTPPPLLPVYPGHDLGARGPDFEMVVPGNPSIRCTYLENELNNDLALCGGALSEEQKLLVESELAIAKHYLTAFSACGMKGGEEGEETSTQPLPPDEEPFTVDTMPDGPWKRHIEGLPHSQGGRGGTSAPQ